MENITYINKILTSEDLSKKEEFIKYVECLIEKTDDTKKEEMERWLYEISEGKVLNEKRASELIAAMKPHGQKWTLEETEGVRKQYEYETIRPVDFWIVMNSAYNDYEDIFKDNVEYYARFSKDFIQDEDAVDDKVYYYFSMIPKK